MGQALKWHAPFVKDGRQFSSPRGGASRWPVSFSLRCAPSPDILQAPICHSDQGIHILRSGPLKNPPVIDGYYSAFPGEGNASSKVASGYEYQVVELPRRVNQRMLEPISDWKDKKVNNNIFFLKTLSGDGPAR